MPHTVIRRTATVKDVFIGTDYFDLALPIGPLSDLEDALECGAQGILMRFVQGSWKSKELLEVLRYSLIGGGMPPQEAKTLVDAHVVSGYLREYYGPVLDVLGAALYGIAEDPVGEEPAVPMATETATTQTPEQSGQPITEPLARSATRRKKSAA